MFYIVPGITPNIHIVRIFLKLLTFRLSQRIVVYMKAKRSTQQTPEPRYGALVIDRELWHKVKTVAEREDRNIISVAERALGDYIAKSDAAALLAGVSAAPAPEGA